MAAYLEISHAEGTEAVPLEGVAVTIGRGDSNDICLDDPAVSRRHAVIEKLAAGWSIQDVGSLNGTFVNGAMLERPRPLYSGDEIVIGDTQLIYHSGALG